MKKILEFQFLKRWEDVIDFESFQFSVSDTPNLRERRSALDSLNRRLEKHEKEQAKSKAKTTCPASNWDGIAVDELDLTLTSTRICVPASRTRLWSSLPHNGAFRKTSSRHSGQGIEPIYSSQSSLDQHWSTSLQDTKDWATRMEPWNSTGTDIGWMGNGYGTNKHHNQLLYFITI